MALRKTWLFPVLWCCWLSLPAQPSVLHQGDWYKLAVEKTGVYRISFDLLKKMGINPGKINPQNIRIYGREGGMLPQPNSAFRPEDLSECAITVYGEEDGSFDRGDYILFYGEGPDDYEYDLARRIFHYENNLYSDRNFYFLTVGDDRGKRITVSENMAGTFPLITTYDDFAFHETNEYNIEKSGREWFGEKFGLTNSYTFTFNLPGIAPGSLVRVVSDVLGQTYTEASMKLFFNDMPIAEQKLAAIPQGRYSVKGLHKRDTLILKAEDIAALNRGEQKIRYEFIKGTGSSQAYLDFLLVSVVRTLARYDNQTFFVSASSLDNPVSTFRMGGMTSGVQVWDITDHYNVRSQEFSLNATEGTFSTPTDNLKKWVVFNTVFPEPVFVSKVGNQDLSSVGTPNLLIITHPDFRAQAERLAQHRRSFSGWSVVVVSTEEIYNEFSGGRQDVTALRDFARTLFDKDADTFKAILLFGKGSYDYKDKIVNNTNFVPTYQSRNSLHPLQTYASDDYFAFLENDEGFWGESPAQHHTLDVGIGRLPVKSAEEAGSIVDKILAYDTDPERFGGWRKKIVFVADDGNGEDNYTSLHQYQADQLATNIDQYFPEFDARRLFMGSYKKDVQPSGETVPAMADDIKRAFDQGALIINFTGHGSETVWTDERILTDKTIAELSNDRYPFLVTATCEFGRQDDPLQVSSAERVVMLKDGGAIGMVTTARPVNATTNFSLNAAFYEALFKQSSGAYAPIGVVFLETKNNSASGVANRNFSLIGDPSMTLAMPAYSVQVSSVKTALGSDTLKALSTVIVSGAVFTPDGQQDNTFDGEVEATLYDKEKDFVTIGKNNPPFAYRQWDNAVYRGRATVKAGAFTLTFVMPRNIAYQIGEGKLSLYAFDEETGVDAKGVGLGLRIGGSEKNVAQDNMPPTIRLFMGDTTFVNGGVTASNTYLIARLSDENGINISGYGIGNSIIAQLDDSASTMVLNDYYYADRDTYKTGTIRFPVLGLAPGHHTITVNAWDVYNNPAEASLSFIVPEGSGIVVEEFGNYPNPFSDKSTLFFTHNRSGEALKAQLFIFSPSGELVRSADIDIAESAYLVNLTEFEALDRAGKKLAPGLYFARLIVRSSSDGSKNEKVTKLIILN